MKAELVGKLRFQLQRDESQIVAASGMQAVLRQGGLVAVLSFLDFFQTSVQRVAVATAAAMCRGLSHDSVEAVSSAVPILTNILQYEVPLHSLLQLRVRLLPPRCSLMPAN